jgi:hypothetical protein
MPLIKTSNLAGDCAKVLRLSDVLKSIGGTRLKWQIRTMLKPVRTRHAVVPHQQTADIAARRAKARATP